MHIATKLVLAGLAMWSFSEQATAQSRPFNNNLPAVAVPSVAGKVDGLSMNSDQFMWNTFLRIVKPVVAHPGIVDFQTWASDEDLYTANPVWPVVADAVRLHNNIGARAHLHGPALDEPCAPVTNTSANPPPNPYVANFPLDGCITEEVRRNRPQFNYLVDNELYTAAGLAAFYAGRGQVDMPRESLSIKVDWVPVATILEWVPQLKTLRNVRRSYYTTVSENVEYGLVAMHLVSKQNPLWVWATFEHRNNPGRCDATGCYDSYGALRSVVLPNDKTANTQYGSCTKSLPLKVSMAREGVSPVWENYCLKSTQVNFVSDSGKPTILTNSVTERIAVDGELIGSCITCHAYASFGSAGTVTEAGNAMLTYNPVGKVFPSALEGTKTYDFMWGVLNAQ